MLRMGLKVAPPSNDYRIVRLRAITAPNRGRRAPQLPTDIEYYFATGPVSNPIDRPKWR